MMPKLFGATWQKQGQCLPSIYSGLIEAQLVQAVSAPILRIQSTLLLMSRIVVNCKDLNDSGCDTTGLRGCNGLHDFMVHII